MLLGTFLVRYAAEHYARTLIPRSLHLANTSSQNERFKIYTKTGDKGTTSLYTGERRVKDDNVFEALGTTDELSCFIGLAHHHCTVQNNGLPVQLEKIQCILQELGSHIATPRQADAEAKKARTIFPEQHTQQLEHWIDLMDGQLPPLKNFILPSGGLAGTSLHCARAVCRRNERVLVPLHKDHSIDDSAYRFINRLSDYLFMAARFASKHEGAPEIIYRKSIITEEGRPSA